MSAVHQPNGLAPDNEDTVPLWRVRLGDRMTRVEVQVKASHIASDKQGEAVVRAIERMIARLDEIEKRQWRLTVGIALVGLGGGAGALDLLRSWMPG